MTKVLSSLGASILIFFVFPFSAYAGGDPCADWQINPHNKCEVFFRNAAMQDVIKNSIIIVLISLIVGVLLSKIGVGKEKVITISLLVLLLGQITYLLLLPPSIRIYLLH